MTSELSRAYVSYNRAEWWYPHLVESLAEQVDVVRCPMQRFNQPGYPVEFDLNAIVDAASADNAFYLGSIDQLFAGLARLPVRTAIWTDVLAEAVPTHLMAYRLFDVVFSTQKDSIPVLQRHGLEQVEWLPFAYDTRLQSNPNAEKVYDVGFVGSLTLPASRAERAAILSQLEARYRLNDYRRAVYGDEMMAVYNQSRIVVNIPVPGGFNMRTFEAMASGALLLTKRVGNGQDDLFTEGRHYVAYESVDDLLDKVRYFLRFEAERTQIADQGRREILAHHTYAHRARRVCAVMADARRSRDRDRTSQIAAYARFYDYLGRPDLLARIALSRGVPPRQRAGLLARAALRLGRSAVSRRPPAEHGTALL